MEIYNIPRHDKRERCGKCLHLFKRSEAKWINEEHKNERFSKICTTCKEIYKKMKNYKEKARECRLKVLEMIHKAGTSHIASNFSIIDVATVLYENLKPEDKVVWSKGWVAATIYYFLAKQGHIPIEDLEMFGKEYGGQIPYLGLVETSTRGVYANAGSMGHGLPIACGMALAKKLKGEKGNIYCIMSDGELNEGTTWESAMFAAHHKLDNLVVIVDKNKWQAMGKCEDVLNVNIAEAFRGFGWGALVRDGHDFEQIESGLSPFMYVPTVTVFNTIKGKGVSFMEDHLLYHYKHVDEENYKMAKAELENA